MPGQPSRPGSTAASRTASGALLLTGHGASRGNALGRARVRLPHALEVAEQRIPPAKVEAELQRLHQAVDAARAEMHDLRQRLQGALNKEVANSSTCTHCCWTTRSCCSGWMS